MRNKVVISLLTATAVPMGAMANADVSAKVEASDAHKLTAEGQTGHLSEAGMLAAQALGANDNDDAYAEVASAVAEATKCYNKAVDDVVKTLGGAVWEGYRDVVLKELAVYYQAIVAVGKNNGTDDAHENAFDNKAANLAALESAKAGITAKKDEAIKKYTDCEDAKAKANGVVDGLNNRFAEVKELLVDPTKPHTEDVDSIQSRIDKLTASIDKANAAHTIDKLNYTDQQAAIEAALAKLSTEATAEKANYEAKLRLDAKQSELETAFEAAKAAARACKDEEGSFDGEALWQKTVESLTNTVATCQSAIDNHYADGDCAKEEKAISGSIADAKEAVENYQTEVEEAFAKYQNAKNAIAEYQAALDSVKVYVDNLNVTCRAKEQTYEKVINDLQDRINAVTDALNTVMAENKDDALAAELAKLDLDGALVDDIAVITEDKYKEDKAAYDKLNKVDAAKTYATTVSSKVTETENKLSALWTKLQENPAAYGLSWNTLVDTKNALNDSLNDVKAALPADEDAINKDNADKWLTDLPAISKTLDAISADIDKLATDAETIESKVVANKNFYDARTADVKAERDKLDKITTTDPDKAHEVAADKADAENLLNDFQGKIYNAYATETLKAEWDESLATKWTEIQATIAGYVTKADQVEKNFQAYTTQKDTAQFADYLTAAAAELNKDEVCTGDGRKYFQGVLAGYEGEANTLISNIHAWYGEGISAEKTDVVKAKTQQLIANIKAVPTLAHANDSVHTVQTNKLTEVQAEWTRVYNRFSAEDESSKKQEYLSDMANFQLRINALDDRISKAFAAGTSVQGAYEDSLTLLKVEITNKEAAWNGEYDKTLAKDNAARYENFCKAYDDALTKYSKVAGNIEKFNAVSEVYFPGKAEIIKVAKDELYQFSLDIIALKKTARDEYEHLPERTLYDPTEAHTTEVSSIIAQMNATYEAFLEQANSSATTQYAEAWDNANKTIEEALVELGEDREYGYEMLDEVFAGVYKVLNDNYVADPAKDEMLATKVEVLITNLNTVPGLVDAAKEKASQRWYAATMDSLTALHDTQVDSLSYEFKYAEVTESDRFLETYNNAWEHWIVNGAQAFGDAAVESGTMYSAYNYVVSCISSFTAKNGYDDAVKAAQQNTNSLAAYAVIMDSLAATQDKLDALKAYADGYFVDGSGYVNPIQTQLDDILADADNAKFLGTAVSDKEALLAACADAESKITAAYGDVDQKEYDALMQVWSSIKIDFVSAAPALDADAVEKYQKTIEAYPSRILEIKNTEDAEARHAAFIALEKEMAVTKTELVALYDEAKIDGIYNELCTAITAVSTQQAAAAETLATMHQPVQDQFSEQLAAIVTAVESAQAAVDADKAASTLILYADNRKAEVGALQKQLDALTSAIAAAEAPYVANDEAYARLTVQLQGYKTAADSVAERIHSYGDTYINQESFDSEMQSQVYDKLTAAAEALEAAHNATEVDEMLNEHSTLTGCSGVENALTLLDKTYSHYEGSGYINAISNRHNEVYNSFMLLKYDDETRSELASKISEIGSALWQISDTHNQAYNGYSDDEDREISVEEYCTVVVPAVRDSLAELSEQLDALETEVEEKSYTPGDVNRDGKILVDDYSAVLDVALEYTTYEPGSVEFLAADINSDGRVNIGDVTAVARILRGENAQGVRAIARTGMQQVTDALGFAAEGTGTRQRIAISLDGSRDYVGGQLDIRLPQGVTLVGESLGQAAEGLTLQSNDLQDGAHRVLFSSPEGTLMGRSGVLLYLEVEVSHSYSGEGFDVANVLLADEAARTYALATPADGEATGVGRVSLTEEWKTKVYNLGGILMDGLKRGVNILRGSDGTSRKVIVK